MLSNQDDYATHRQTQCLLRSAGAAHRPRRAARGQPGVPAPGSIEFAQGWALISANRIADSSAVISQTGYNTNSWYPVTVPSTVMAGLVANGVYADLFMGTNMLAVPDLTTQQWWFRGQFTAPVNPGGQYWLRFKGVSYKAGIWLNEPPMPTPRARWCS